MGYHAVHEVPVRQQETPEQIQKRRGQFRLRADQVEGWTFDFRDVVGIVGPEPFPVEGNLVPPIGQDRLDILRKGGDNVKEHPATVTTRFVAEHLEKRVVCRGQVVAGIPEDQHGAGFPLGDLRETGMEKREWHPSELCLRLKRPPDHARLPGHGGNRCTGHRLVVRHPTISPPACQANPGEAGGIRPDPHPAQVQPVGLPLLHCVMDFRERRFSRLRRRTRAAVR